MNNTPREMESSTGPRDEGVRSTHRYNGSVAQSRRIPPSSSGTMSRHLPSRSGPNGDESQPPPSRRGRKIHWPFQSIATDTMSIFTSHAPELFRRTTVHVPNRPMDTDSTTGARESTLIPDYVVNFIRGETPETVARRKQNGGNQGERAVDITHQHRHQRSHMALLESADDNDGRRAYDSMSNFTWSSTMTQLQQMLPWSGEKPGTRRRLTSGWRFGVIVNMLLILIILITGFICAVLAGTRLPILVGDMTIYSGTCQGARNIDWGLHGLINVFVMVLIVGANYVYQVLSSPTRSEISGAHDARQWLEIGVPSARNLKHVAKGRALLAIILLSVAVVTQIIYNSIIFITQSEVNYSLTSDTAEQACTVQLGIISLIIVLGLNVVTLLATGATLILRHFEPLVTLGDAISSFLRDPDPSTRTNCLLTKENLRTDMGGWGFDEGKYWAPTRNHMWFRSPSLANWAVAGSWWVVSAGLTLGALALTVADQSPTPESLSPFGTASPRTTYLLSASASAAVPAGGLAIAAAIPQLFLAGLYLSTNALLTSYFLSRESAQYAVLDDRSPGRPLRVSADPDGRQTTSLYLTLPRPVSWALAVFFASMGFVLSQACFVVSESTGAAAQQRLLGVGLSGVALLALLAMLIVLCLAVTGMGFLRAPSAAARDGRAVGNPLVFEGGSCSAVISARCHRVPWEADVWKQNVGFGVVPDMPGAAISHATYSARTLAELDETRRYA